MGIIRFLLALTVVVVHAGGNFPMTANQMVTGGPAVQAFFVISGFYMALILNEKYSRLSDFYYNRAVRLFPTYWVTLLLFFAWQYMTGHPNSLWQTLYHPGWTWGAKLYALFTAIFIAGSEWMYLLLPTPQGLELAWNHPRPFYPAHPDPPIWSLGMELFFYALAPVLVRRRSALLLAILGSVVIRAYTYQHFGYNDTWVYRFFLSELLFFCLGIVCYAAYLRVRHWPHASEAGVIAMVLVVWCIANGNRLPILFSFHNPLFGAWQVQFFLIFMLCLPFIFIATQNNRYDRWIGELSYPMYVSHWWIVHHKGFFGPLSRNPQYNVILWTILVSALVHIFFQLPVESLLKRRGGDLKTPSPAADGPQGLVV